MFKCVYDHFNISEDFYNNCGTFFYNFILKEFNFILKEILRFDKKGTFSSRFFFKDCLFKVTIFRRANPLNLCPAWSRMVEKILLVLTQYRFIENDLKGFLKNVLFSTKYESADIPKAIFKFCLFCIHYHKCMLVQF